jgi:hypothetical protein
MLYADATNPECTSRILILVNALAFRQRRLWIAIRLYGSVSIEGTDVDRMRDSGLRLWLWM